MPSNSTRIKDKVSKEERNNLTKEDQCKEIERQKANCQEGSNRATLKTDM